MIQGRVTGSQANVGLITRLDRQPDLDDSVIRVNVHASTILWNGEEHEVAVPAMGKRPLAGTSLLDGHHVGIDFVDGGDVQIDRL